MNLVLTDTELTAFLDELDTLEESIYKVGLGSSLQDNVNSTKLVKPYLGEQVLSTLAPDTLSTALADLRRRLESMTKIQITTAFAPDYKFILKLKDWVNTNIKKDILVDFEFDPMLLGGAQVIYNGRYKDYSLAKSLDTYFKGFTNVDQLPR